MFTYKTPVPRVNLTSSWTYQTQQPTSRLLKLLVYTNKLPQTWFCILSVSPVSAAISSWLFSLAPRAPWMPSQQLHPIIVRTDACSWILQNNVCVFSIFTLSNSETEYLTAPSETLHVILSSTCLISGLLWPPNKTGWQIKTQCCTWLACQMSRKLQQLCFSNIWPGAPLQGSRIVLQPGLACSRVSSHAAPSDHTHHSRDSTTPASTLTSSCHTFGELWANS